VFDRYSILEILAGDVRFVNLFRHILPVVPTQCDVLIVCRQHNDKEWKLKEQHAKMWENIAGSRPRGLNSLGLHTRTLIHARKISTADLWSCPAIQLLVFECL